LSADEQPVADGPKEVAKDKIPEEGARQKAIERGVAFLKQQQLKDGTWDAENFPQAVTSLCAYALLRSGADPKDAALQKAIDDVKRQPAQQLYTVAVQLLALAAADPKEHSATIQERAAWLEKAQVRVGGPAGGWSYVLQENAGRADGSCTRFALLALHRAVVAGAKVQPDTWRLAEQYWMQSQRDDGGWGYVPGNGNSTVTMTLAGIASLSIVRQHRGADSDKKTSEAITRAQSWLDGRLDSEKKEWRQQGWREYCFHCGERVATLTGRGQIGKTDWQTDWLPSLLVDQDAKTGSWNHDPQFELINTSLALLCLTPEPEATKPAE
jgi:hypothetical protein